MDLIAWLADNPTPPQELWKALVQLPRESHATVLGVFGVPDMPLSMGVSSPSDDDGGTPPPPKRVHKRKIIDSDDEDDFVVDDDAPLEYDDDDDEWMPGLDDVGNVYSTPLIDDDDGYFELIEVKGGKCTVQWYYTRAQLPQKMKRRSESLAALVRRVEKINGTVLFTSDHEQELSPTKCDWTDVTNRVFTSRVIPTVSIAPRSGTKEGASGIDLYVIGAIDTTRMRYVESDSDAGFIINQLMTIGPDAGAWLKARIGLHTPPGSYTEDDVAPRRGTCGACKRQRRLTKRIKFRDTPWINMGRFCARRVSVAHQLSVCKDPHERTLLVDEAAEVMGDSDYTSRS
jgi:hypothetical protein